MADPWSALAKQVPVSALRRYLRSQRWQVQLLDNDRTDLFYLTSGDESSVELFIPKTNESIGATKYKIYALETLSDLLRITPTQLLNKLRSIGFDV
ncbi:MULTISPECIES: hypothetical protein [unclassified Methylobacterium]|uniref:hypothetical protein n=1 Tax=unclassified Methylobacterium TaxID=2615210 RepID=UPI00226AAAF9|nr:MULTISPECIES: hypothetical protein [unclassified Methylobacterium]